MAHHELTDEERLSQRSKEQIDLWDRVFIILDDLEDRLKKLETKSKQ
mgnify:FL=1|tara:strand:+ start:91 stop:231 length:141 start_codon:yes stop_codon:yes gene_type:complete